MQYLKILILDDEEIIQKGLTQFFLKKNFHVFNAYHPAQAFEILKDHCIDIMLLDVKLPGMNGISVLKVVKDQFPDIEIIMITGHGETETIIQAMQYGAIDYFYKPISFIDIQSAIERTTKYVSLQNHLNQVKNAFSLLTNEFRDNIGGEIIGRSNVIKKVLELTLKAAQSDDTPVLIIGPSGSGKELIARTIHYLGNRKEAYFYPVNCAAVPETLIESEFFGHIKGAFTGAIENKKGIFEIAGNGSLFIDEIGDMPYSAQSKLLRVLETKKARRVGDVREFSINSRIISASNKNLKKMIQEGQFRLDLYYRLNIFEINVPALNERKEDIPLLLEYYIDHYAKKLNKPIKEINEEVQEFLINYDFPGNVRELKNMAERAVILCESGNIKLKHFPITDMVNLNSQNHEISNLEKQAKDDLDIEKMEKDNILRALNKTDQNISEAAKLLHISRPALYRRMSKYKIK